MIKHNTLLEDIQSSKTIGYIINESSTFGTPKIISPNKNTDRVYIETILQDANVQNRNKRIYSKDAIQSGLSTEYIKERLETESWYGEAGHPLEPNLQRQLHIDQSNMSHIILSCEWRGDVLYGIIRAASTARGDDFNRTVKDGTKVGFSMRGVGSVVEKRNGFVVVKPPMTILTYDWILHPSHKTAYMTKILNQVSNTNGLVTENVNMFELIKTEQAREFIKNNSKNLRLMSESLMVNINDFLISEDYKSITANIEDYGKVVIKTDDFIRNEIKSHLKLL